MDFRLEHLQQSPTARSAILPADKPLVTVNRPLAGHRVTVTYSHRETRRNRREFDGLYRCYSVIPAAQVTPVGLNPDRGNNDLLLVCTADKQWISEQEAVDKWSVVWCRRQ